MCAMELADLRARFDALRKSVAEYRRGYKQGLVRLRMVVDYFTQYAECRQTLVSELPSALSSLPSGAILTNSDAQLVNGVEYIRPELLGRLAGDIDLCLSLLSHVLDPERESLKATREGIFFAGQSFDAMRLVMGLLGDAKRDIAVIDGYIGQVVLDLLTAKDSAVAVRILTKQLPPAVKAAATAFNQQYGGLSIRQSSAFHDRFIIVDDTDFYHLGASIKDAGRRAFMFSRIEEPDVLERLRTSFEGEWAKSTVIV